MAWQLEANPKDSIVQEDVQNIKEQNAKTEGKRLTWGEFFSNGRDMNLWRVSAACGAPSHAAVQWYHLEIQRSDIIRSVGGLPT